MKIKTSELTGRALDWAVCLAIGGAANKDNTEVQAPNRDYYLLSNGKGNFAPSTDWAQCGQLIEKYEMDLTPVMGGTYCAGLSITDGALCTDDYVSIVYGDTPQIAICRAVVAAQLGDEVDIPDELVEGI
ncbi:conserved hypothetical protein [Xenorhabdus bovienii str. puntauvense]|uniref:DUF2591 domain-containing protein n=1 Tax=Xenorhabdus bovienii str. puntauvense TaxID=1398201 RepID=A0A077N189_XENBV|nr:phage protein NinX family protein [Xenorhabdus bovienii]CDG95856.1 conserved hypothetical protein [Xenorhabdus bovienii str. puntauvense]